jgi:hypothetical protein
MRRRKSGWPKQIGAALALGVTAGAVVGLRVMKLARGGRAAGRESVLMVDEKLRTACDANVEVLRSITRGKAGRAPERVLGLYQKRVAANLRRLSKAPGTTDPGKG